MADTLDIAALRERLKLSQAEMGKRMGLGARAYFTLEQNPASVKPRHRNLAHMVSLRIARERRNPMLATEEVRAAALDIAGMLGLGAK